MSEDLDPEKRTLERRKELDHLHRGRLRAAPGLALSMRFLAAAVRRLRTPTRLVKPVPVPRPASGTLAVTFVGHATVMLSTPRTRVLTDPLFGNFLYGLRRATSAALAPSDLGEVGLVVVSHAHHDHLRRPSLRLVPRSATVIVPPRCGDLVSDLGFARTIELGLGGKEIIDGVEVTAVAASHGGGRGGIDLARRPACGYVLRGEGQCVYFAGDTAYFSGFVEIGERFRPDVALLPIAGYEPASFRADHMSPLDAVFAFEDLGAATMIPIAHGSFPLSYEPLEAPLAWLREIAVERGLGEKVCMLEHGDTFVSRRK